MVVVVVVVVVGWGAVDLFFSRACSTNIRYQYQIFNIDTKYPSIKCCRPAGRQACRLQKKQEHFFWALTIDQCSERMFLFFPLLEF